MSIPGSLLILDNTQVHVPAPDARNLVLEHVTVNNPHATNTIYLNVWDPAGGVNAGDLAAGLRRGGPWSIGPGTATIVLNIPTGGAVRLSATTGQDATGDPGADELELVPSWGIHT